MRTLPQGSLRDIQVKRDGQTVTHFDLYDLLLHGDKSKDVRLEPGDVIFIPDVGPQVAVIGSVTTQAVYELHGEKTFNQVIALAGGLTNAAAGSKVRVERIDNHTQHSIIEVDLAAADSPPVQDGDILNVNSILGRFDNAVTLRGNVANPGRYVWHQGMRISDLIPSREALVTRNYYLRQNQLGQTIPDYSPDLSASSGSFGLRSEPASNAAGNPANSAPNGSLGMSSRTGFRHRGKPQCAGDQWRRKLGRRGHDCRHLALRPHHGCGSNRARYRLELRRHRKAEGGGPGHHAGAL